MLPSLFIIVCFVGLLIGSVGVGGVLLAPSLAYIGGLPLHAGIPICMLGYVGAGIAGATVYARHGSFSWPMGIWLAVGAIPGALAGALLLPLVSARILELLIGALCLSSGIQSWRARGRPEAEDNNGSFKRGRMAVIGLITGAGSALSGTGGPLLLIPMLMWVR